MRKVFFTSNESQYEKAKLAGGLRPDSVLPVVSWALPLSSRGSSVAQSVTGILLSCDFTALPFVLAENLVLLKNLCHMVCVPCFSCVWPWEAYTYISLSQSGHLLQTALRTHVPTSISYATIEKHPWEAQSRCQWRLIPRWVPRVLPETGALCHLRRTFQDVQILIHANKAKQAEHLLREEILQCALRTAWERTGPGNRAAARSGRYFWVRVCSFKSWC